MSWVLLTLLAVNLWAISNVIDKHIINRHVRNPWIIVSIETVTTILLTSLIVLFSQIFVPDTAHAILGIVVGFLWFGGIVFYFRALQDEEVSRVVPFFAIIPIFTLLLATVLLKETFTPGKYAGILLLVIGAFLISYRKGKPN